MNENQALSEGLNLGSFDASKIKTQPQARAAMQQIGMLQAQKEGELKGAEIDWEVNKAREQAAAATKVANEARTKIEQTHEKEAAFPYPEFHPTQDNASSLAGLFSIVGTVGMMLGNSGKQSALNAMNAMTGMMTGWQKGRADLFKNEKERFDKEFQRIKVMRDDLRKDLDDYMKLVPIDKEAAMYKAAEMSAKAGRDSIVSKYIETGQYKKLYELISGIDKAIEKRQEIEARRTEANKANYQYYTDKEGNIHYFNTKNPRDFGMVSGVSGGGMTKLGATQKEAGIPKKGEYQAKFVSETIGKNVDVDTAGKLVSGLSYIDGLKELQQKNIELGNAPGLTVALADKINPLLKMQADPATGQQTIDVTQETLDDAWQRALQDKSFASLSDKSKVMAKKQLDTIMLNLQTKYGNRAPVAEFRAAQNVLSRGMASPTAFNQTMKEETDATYKRLFGLGYGMQDINKMENRLKQSAQELTPLAGGQSNTDRVTGLPLTNEKGWKLESDGQGTYLYINPQNRKEYEEAE